MTNHISNCGQQYIGESFDPGASGNWIQSALNFAYFIVYFLMFDTNSAVVWLFKTLNNRNKFKENNTVVGGYTS